MATASAAVGTLVVAVLDQGHLGGRWPPNVIVLADGNGQADRLVQSRACHRDASALRVGLPVTARRSSTRSRTAGTTSRQNLSSCEQGGGRRPEDERVEAQVNGPVRERVGPRLDVAVQP